MTSRDPRILVFDSGFGGLSVLTALQSVMPFASYVYLADDARFPYGDLSDADLTNGLVALIEDACEQYGPDLLVVACNTASTVALTALRSRFSFPIVGVVPGIKPAARATKSGKVAVLATPGTIKRAYTQELIRAFATECNVAMIACTKLAALAEGFLLEGRRDDQAVWAEVAPAFEDPEVDVVVLGCTHYPLLLPVLKDLAPHPVRWIDPAPAIARRVMHLLEQEWQDCVAPHSADGKSAQTISTKTQLITTGTGQTRLEAAWAALNRC